MRSSIKRKISKMDTDKLIKIKKRNEKIFFIGWPVLVILFLTIVNSAKKFVMVIFVGILLFILSFVLLDFLWEFGIKMIRIELKEREEKAEENSSLK